jgi:CRISPR-associated protein (TIGR03986 family)
MKCPIRCSPGSRLPNALNRLVPLGTEGDISFSDQYNNRHDHSMYLRFRAVRQADFDASAIPGALEGTLVLTGPMQNKHMEFVFLHNPPGMPGTRSPLHGTLDPAMIDRFHDDDQISQWQERNFPVNKPHPHSRRRPGMLRDGEPVFFLLGGGEVRFFGRAQMFRLPYEYSPYELIPADLRDSPVLDIAEAIFGYVRGSKREKPRAGRVFVSDAHLVTPSGSPWLRDTPITPRILSTPKPTTFQHYLVQDNTNRLRHFSSPDAEIRGHKRYWHKGEVEVEQIEDAAFMDKIANPSRCEPNENPLTDTQHTCLRPVKPGVEFCFAITSRISPMSSSARCYGYCDTGMIFASKTVRPSRTVCHSGWASHLAWELYVRRTKLYSSENEMSH